MHINHPHPHPVHPEGQGETEQRAEEGRGLPWAESRRQCVLGRGAAVGCPGNDYHVSLIKSNLGWQEQLMSGSPSSCRQLLELLGRNDD